MHDSLPRRISPDPILEAIMEVRFTPQVPTDALVGLVYGAVRHWFPNMQALPVANLPENIRSQDPNLVWQATHQLQAGHLVLKIGPRVLGFSSLRRYDGWPAWSAFRQTILEALGQAGIFGTVERLGLRYVNFFRLPLLDQLELAISLVGSPVSEWSSTCRFEIPDSGIMKTLQVANRINLNVDQESIPGSLLDIDCLLPCSLDGPSFIRDHQLMADRLHGKAKELFFSLLKPQLLASLNPEY